MQTGALDLLLAVKLIPGALQKDFHTDEFAAILEDAFAASNAREDASTRAEPPSAGAAGAEPPRPAGTEAAAGLDPTDQDGGVEPDNDGEPHDNDGEPHDRGLHIGHWQDFTLITVPPALVSEFKALLAGFDGLADGAKLIALLPGQGQPELVVLPMADLPPDLAAFLNALRKGRGGPLAAQVDMPPPATVNDADPPMPLADGLSPGLAGPKAVPPAAPENPIDEILAALGRQGLRIELSTPHLWGGRRSLVPGALILAAGELAEADAGANASAINADAFLSGVNSGRAIQVSPALLDYLGKQLYGRESGPEGALPAPLILEGDASHLTLLGASLNDRFGQLSSQAALNLAALKQDGAGGPRAIVDQIAIEISRAIGQGLDRVRIRLYPSELGRIDVRLDVADAQLRVWFNVERLETLDLLRRDSRLLEQTLNDAGFAAKRDDLYFGLAGRQRDQADRPEQNPAHQARASAENEAMTEASGKTPRAPHLGLLDIWI
jgi:hypothetical protein